MKMLKSISLRVLFAALILVFSGLGISESNTAMARPPHGNPAWAPPYYSGVRYYYLPDIEAYYDLQRAEFVYYRDGRWILSATLPGIFAGFDLYNGFVVAINAGISDPWRNHKIYVTRYPRYYYEDVYYKRNIRDIRGYNENSRCPYYSKQGAKHGNWKEMYRNDRSWKSNKEYEKARKQEWKEQRKQDRNDRGNRHNNGKGHGNKDDRD